MSDAIESVRQNLLRELEGFPLDREQRNLISSSVSDMDLASAQKLLQQLRAAKNSIEEAASCLQAYGV